MGLFSKILDKLGLQKEKEMEKPAAAGTTSGAASMPPKAVAPAPAPKVMTPAKPAGPAAAPGKAVGTAPRPTDKMQKDDMAARTAPAPVASREMSQVDVMNMLEQKAKGTGLNWKQSISDLLFLLEIDNSYDARVELAKELEAPQEVLGDSARMNTWLHKTVLKKIAENGGNIPQELLD